MKIFFFNTDFYENSFFQYSDISFHNYRDKHLVGMLQPEM